MRAREAAWWAVPVALLLWQVPAEVGAMLLGNGAPPEVAMVPRSLSPAFVSLPQVAPSAGPLLVALLLGLAVLGVAVVLGVRLVGDALGGLMGFLALWMLVVLAGGLADTAVSGVLRVGLEGAAGAGFPLISGWVWGVVLGWPVALAATWSGRRSRLPSEPSDPSHDPAPAT